jgi:hypothetical protein
MKIEECKMSTESDINHKLQNSLTYSNIVELIFEEKATLPDEFWRTHFALKWLLSKYIANHLFTSFYLVYKEYRSAEEILEGPVTEQLDYWEHHSSLFSHLDKKEVLRNYVNLISGLNNRKQKLKQSLWVNEFAKRITSAKNGEKIFMKPPVDKN